MKQRFERNKRITIKLISMICLSIILAFLVPKGTFSATQTNSAPQFYGTTSITIKVGDTLDLKNSFYRIFAKDPEDGELTKDIKVTNNTVNTAQQGSYEISYEVSDSDNNTVSITVPVNVISEGERKIQRTLYTLPKISHMNNTEFYRGNEQDKQDLGIYIPADASVIVKQVNDTGKNLEVQFLNDDVLKENTNIYTFEDDSKEEEEIKFTNEKSFDSVPFVKTLYDTKGVTPVIEITLNDSVKPLDYYTYGDSMEEFKNQWNISKNEFAVLEGNRVTFLVPYNDLEDLGKSKKTDNSSDYQNDTFNSIDDLLTYYDELIEEYDEWIGLSYNPSKTTDQNIKTKFFIKANINGRGYAAYNYANYTYRTAYSLDTFLHNAYDGWAPLHEIGHGYQGSLKTKILALEEVSNNILAYYYQKENLQGSWFGNIEDMDKEIMQNVREKEESYLVRNGNENQGTENVDIYHLRLYGYINLLNKIGAKKSMAGLYSYYREEVNNASVFVQSINKAPDVFSIGFSNSSGYNVIPYFKEWKLKLDKNTENEIYSKDYPIVYFLRDLVKDDAQAEAIKKELNLEGIYSLVSNEDISAYNLKGNVNINLSIEEFNNLKGYDILLKSGGDVIKQVSVTSENLTISDVPIGAYEIETTRVDKTIAPRYVAVQQENTSDVTVTTENAELTGIKVTTLPSKTEYIEGENFDSTGMVVTATYDNGSTAPVTDYAVTDGDNLTVGQTSVTISYMENGITKTTEQEITVLEKLKINLGNYKETTESENIYLENIYPSTKISEFKNNIQTNGEIGIYKGTTEVTDTDAKIATGMTITISKNNEQKTYIAVVTGDLNGDGEMGNVDLLKVARYNAGLDSNLNGVYLKAADIYKDGSYADSKDLLKVARVLAGLENL